MAWQGCYAAIMSALLAMFAPGGPRAGLSSLRLLVPLTSLAAAVVVVGCSASGDQNAGPPAYGNQDGSASSTDGGGKDGSADAADAACVPKTCVQLGATCGSAPDGCGGKLACGSCPTGQQCGGGGTNKCGSNQCTPKSCVSLGASCGYVSDTCSEAIDCGQCAAPYSCGVNAKPNQCGCVPKTCAQLGASCGSVPDGCDGKVDCGSCAAGQTCGGGGTANTCGTGTCAAKTCAQVGASCGFVSDGCSAALNCGSCSGSNVCGGAGKPNQCGCTPKTCSQLGISCGSADNGCGGTVSCGSCPDGESCGGGGTPGQCGCTCSAPNATSSCSAGKCSIVKCQVGWADCDGDVVNGCETDIRTNLNNCGICGKSCAYDNADALCTGGSCVLGPCHNGFANCDGAAANGCETDTTNDPKHCGSCSTVCEAANGTPDCAGGNCGVACNPGWGDCNSSVADGCETDLTSSLDHCGTCATNCANPQPPNVADETCTNSACTIAACAANTYDMNGSYADGCECTDDGIPNACGSATTIAPGTLAPGTATTQSGNLVPTGDEDWYVVTFGSPNTCYQPKVELEDQSGTGTIRIDVTTDCAGAAIACSEGGTSVGTITWEFTYTATCGANAAIDPAKQASAFTTVYIHVYATGPSTTCLPYVLHVSN